MRQLLGADAHVLEHWTRNPQPLRSSGENSGMLQTAADGMSGRLAKHAASCALLTLNQGW